MPAKRTRRRPPPTQAGIDERLVSSSNPAMPTLRRKNAISWFELAALDFKRAVGFYGTVLDIELEDVSSGSHHLALFPCDPDSGVGGSISAAPEVVPAFGGTLVYLDVDGELDAVLARIPSAGGKVLRPRSSLGDQGAIAVFSDTEGNIVGLHSRSG